MRLSAARKAHAEMKYYGVLLAAVVSLLLLTETTGKEQELRIGVKKRPETCDMRTKAGDRLSMHYTVRWALWNAEHKLVQE